MLVDFGETARLLEPNGPISLADVKDLREGALDASVKQVTNTRVGPLLPSPTAVFLQWQFAFVDGD